MGRWSERRVVHSALSEPPSLVPLDSDEGRKLLGETGTVDHGPLLQWFEGQSRLCFCSVASSVITLNALRERALHDQSAFFSPAIAAIRTEAEVDVDGMTLPDLGRVLGECGARVEVFHAADETLDTFRERAIDNLHRPRDFLIVNYLREVVGQARGGHFSPLAAWHEETDRFLVLDVAEHRYPPVWVSSTRLFAAMGHVDASSGRSRGYLCVSL